MKTTELPIDAHLAVGPTTGMFGHGPVTAVHSYDEDGHPDHGIWLCQDCGYVCSDNRMFLHQECNRTENPINTTWREFLDGAGYPDVGGD